MTDEKAGVIIVAGGRGTRMGADVPKQFLPLAGKPVLVHTVERFRQALPQAQIVVVLPRQEWCRWENIVQAWGLAGTHTVCAGGKTRFESVKNALEAIVPCRLAVIHDGVRPLVSERLIHTAVACALKHGTAVPAVEPVDSYRELIPDGSRPCDRDRLRAVQTPQVFDYELLRAAYDRPYSSRFTDDASVVECAGTPVVLCSGERDNLKITTPGDLIVAEALYAWKDGQKAKR